jgi:probable rRNA maturation factor
MAREMDIDILIEDETWDEAALEALARTCCAQALAELGLDPDGFALSILACDDARIATLNAEFRGKPTPTNVLSWPAEDRAADAPGTMPHLPVAGADGAPEELGDIALALGVVTREAVEAGKPFEHHLAHLIVHGLLHLLGFDHMTDPDAALMEDLETRILARLGIPDPY